jgi:hypothetical protein
MIMGGAHLQYVYKHCAKFDKWYVSRYLICITIRITIRFIGNCNYSSKSMLVDMGAAMFFFIWGRLRTSRNYLDYTNWKGGNDSPFVPKSRLFWSRFGSRYVEAAYNFNFYKSPDNVISNTLHGIGFQQVISDSTHIEGSLLDHIYTNIEPQSQFFFHW